MENCNGQLKSTGSIRGRKGRRRWQLRVREKKPKKENQERMSRSRIGSDKELGHQLRAVPLPLQWPLASSPSNSIASNSVTRWADKKFNSRRGSEREGQTEGEISRTHISQVVPIFPAALAHEDGSVDEFGKHLFV